ncbi:rhodanese-like domain-containing protein [Mycolicibacterium fortuitum]|uniref:rhodanese-like domain-containing protein n=1 Tax=Mycolicibacterium fortuitum TaxID=1766 RepID=UPI0026022594|nr:rhodanese-like domain-containing protein [Mycolicibacterium fortuitum]
MAIPLSDVDPVAAREMLERSTAILIDVRENDEWAAGHAPGAAHVPLADLDPAVYTDGLPLIVVCRTGRRSSKAAAQLASAGLAVHNMAGGMTAWHRAGNSVVRDGGIIGTVI